MLCCNLFAIPHKDVVFTFSNKVYPKAKKIRSGTIILDFKKKKILIIQCYNKHWGLPKGHVEEDETIQECAIRETFEETGIRIDESQLLNKYTIYNGHGVYYTVDGTDMNYDLTNMDNHHEITGISWICMDCLKHMMKTQYITVNSHLRLLIPTIVHELEVY